MRTATSHKIHIWLLALAGLVLVSAACGGSESETTLSPRAQSGQLTALGLGCAACHGTEGEGVEGLGPSWVGLYGREVTLVDGSTVVADRAYLRRSILEPEAELVAGYTLPMPAYDPSPEELEAMLDYLEELE